MSTWLAPSIALPTDGLPVSFSIPGWPTAYTPTTLTNNAPTAPTVQTSPMGSVGDSTKAVSGAFDPARGCSAQSIIRYAQQSFIPTASSRFGSLSARSLSPAHLLYLHRSCSKGPLFAAALPSLFSFSRIQPCRQRCWSRPFSARPKPLDINLDILEEYFRLGSGRCPEIPPWERKSPRAWMSLLDQYLPPSLQNGFTGTSQSHTEHPPDMAQKPFVQAVELAHFLFHARANLNLDLLTHLGFRSGDWAAALKEISLLSKRGFVDEWASNSGVSLDQLTGQHVLSIPRPASLDALTRAPFAQYHRMRLMAEVWKSLGSILAMSYVYRIIARLHHSGAISEPTPRPPGIHLLSVQILDILSNEAWIIHQAEVTAKAAAAGQDSPFLSLKPNLKELGHEIWLEFILWCCVEDGHIEEGIWLVEQMITRRALLQDPESLRKMKIDQKVTWHHGPGSAHVAPWPRKRVEPPAVFHGLGRRVISMEIVSALLDNISNVIYLGLGSRGLRASSFIRHISRLQSAITPISRESNLLPTTKEINRLTVRVVESGGLDPKADPQMFDDFLRVTPCLVPPWSSDMCPVDEESLAQLHPPQLYDDTSAFAGLIEYNLRYYCSQRLLGDASNMFTMLQEVIDASKIRHIDDFFSARVKLPNEDAFSKVQDHEPPLQFFESSIPHISNVTLAELLDLITICRAFDFGEWLLFSDDIDGPTVPATAYGDQALAPSVLRFAAATKNNFLGESVITSLQSPLSLNTLRALCNYRIAMHQWDLVVPLLKYMRDYRLMSWAHSNIAALGAEIIRLEHIPRKLNPGVETDLSQAKEILLRILTGEFHENPHTKRKPQYQHRVLLAFTLLFSRISSPSLREIAGHVYDHRLVPKLNHMYIPPAPFHVLLSAVVETQGSSAGQNLYKRFCVNLDPPALRRIREGGISHLYQSPERNRDKGDPHYDFEYHSHLRKKMGAVREYEQACAAENQAIGAALMNEKETAMETTTDHIIPAPQTDNHSLPNPIVSSVSGFHTATGPAARKAQVEAILFSCIKRFGSMGMSDREITREVGGLVYWKYQQAERERYNDTTDIKKIGGRIRRRSENVAFPISCRVQDLSSLS
ncbi:hypothetical protein BJY00DRAFT_299294 [Aspergillus carlsbadensis]|nr:hypothetical protein BJY00DRAFT_299294 [Aspergillus carlsbadensis]